MAEPNITVTFGGDDDGNGGVTVAVTALPGWHEHPECIHPETGAVLAHMHGMSKQGEHTHLPVHAWGTAVPREKKP